MIVIVIVIPHRIGPGCSFVLFLFLSYCCYESPLSLYLSYSFSAWLGSQLSTQFYHGLYRWSGSQNTKRFNGISMKLKHRCNQSSFVLIKYLKALFLFLSSEFGERNLISPLSNTEFYD